jgi:hypothetical protein
MSQIQGDENEKKENGRVPQGKIIKKNAVS